ncbi:hypothetical protein Nepgr_009401 [Nepenthes gracilis]|uniref:Uncharacterized protein n=1 Tax=Nepenthes gracilis TaxID=150966 RepID=A0AAD3XKC4_NEPGR|nr:hypothetical protein Nepgr_009401 [Nepenthes gracilis]
MQFPKGGGERETKMTKLEESVVVALMPEHVVGKVEEELFARRLQQLRVGGCRGRFGRTCQRDDERA